MGPSGPMVSECSSLATGAPPSVVVGRGLDVVTSTPSLVVGFAGSRGRAPGKRPRPRPPGTRRVRWHEARPRGGAGGCRRCEPPRRDARARIPELAGHVLLPSKPHDHLFWNKSSLIRGGGNSIEFRRDAGARW